MLYTPSGGGQFAKPNGLSTVRPVAAQGTSVTPVTTDPAGTTNGWTVIQTALTEDAYGILININTNSANNAVRRTVVDIGIDYNGGTAAAGFGTVGYIPRLPAGGAAAFSGIGGGHWYYFPLFFPAGASVAARGFSTVPTAFRVQPQFFQQPVNTQNTRIACYAEAIGESTTDGTNFTPSTAATEAAWQILGTNTDPLWWWQVGVQGTSNADTAYATNAILVDLGVGDGTAAGTDVIISDYPIRTDGVAESIGGFPLGINCEWYVPAGSNLYIRGWNTGTNEGGNYNAIAIGAGG